MRASVTQIRVKTAAPVWTLARPFRVRARALHKETIRETCANFLHLDVEINIPFNSYPRRVMRIGISGLVVR